MESTEENLVHQTSILSPHLGTGQTSANGCVLFGTIHFNIGTFRFRNGEARFLLKNADILVDLLDCSCHEPAYVRDLVEAVTTETTTETAIVSSTENKSELNVGVQSNVKQPMTFAMTTGGSATNTDKERLALKGKSTTTTEAIAFNYDKFGGTWFLSGQPQQIRGLVIPRALFGEALLKGRGDEGNLLTIKSDIPTWHLSLKLKFSAHDIHWWSFNGSPPLSTFFEMLSSRRRPEAFISRIALAKWLAKNISRQSFFNHSFDGNPNGTD